MPFITDRQKEVLSCIAKSKYPLTYRELGYELNPQVSGQAAYITVGQLVRKKLLKRDSTVRSITITRLGREFL